MWCDPECLYCPKCDLPYHPPANLLGTPIDQVGCLDEINNVFYAKLGGSTIIVKQPRIGDLPDIVEGMKLASEYTYLRYPSWIWKHPMGICHFTLHKKGNSGRLFLIIMLDGKVVGFSHHDYWHLTEEAQKQENFPIPVGDICGNERFCIFDTYQQQGIETAYVKVSEYIAKHNGAKLLLGDTFKEGDMLDIWLTSGWTNFGERKAEDGSIRIMAGITLG